MTQNSATLIQKILIALLTLIAPFVIYGAVSNMRDHYDVQLMRSTYVSTESLLVITKEIQGQIQLITNYTLENKSDIMDLKQQLQKSNEKIDHILLTYRGEKRTVQNQ